MGVCCYIPFDPSIPPTFALHPVWLSLSGCPLLAVPYWLSWFACVDSILECRRSSHASSYYQTCSLNCESSSCTLCGARASPSTAAAAFTPPTLPNLFSNTLNLLK